MRLALILLFCISSGLAAQDLDSLHQVLARQGNDSGKVDILNRISFLNLAHSLDTMELYAQRAIALGEELNYKRGIAEGHKNLGTAYYAKGSYRSGLEQLFKALKISEQIGDKKNMARVLHNIGGTYFYQEDYARALEFTKRSTEMFQSVGDVEGTATSQLSLCECYVRLGQADQALLFCEKALGVFNRTGNEERQAHAMHYLGGIYNLKKQPAKALTAYWKAGKLVETGRFFSVGVYLYCDLGEFYIESKKYDSSAFYLHKSLTQLKYYDNKDALMLVYQALGDLHERTRQYDSALYYNKLYVNATRKDFNLRRNDQIASLEAHYNLELKSRELQLNQEILRSQRAILVFVGVILAVVLLSSGVIFYLYWQYRAANKRLKELNASIQEKNEEILSQADELQSVNDAMKRINIDLEAMVEERTREVRMQNEKLIEYAYFNAHKVRGPLARIMGLVNVLDLEEHNNSVRLFTEKMRDSALELDDVIREINDKLDTD